MKTLYRFICFMLVFILTAVFVPSASSKAVSDIRFGKRIIQQLNNSNSILKIYDTLAKECVSVPENITIKLTAGSITKSEIETAYKLFYSDYPEYYWLENGMSYTLSSDGTVVVTPSKKMTKAQVEQTQALFNSKVNSLTNDILNKTNYEKSKILHDRLCEIITYTSGNYDQTAYGALMEGKAVCNGYTRAYQLLMQKVGISAWYLNGTGINPATNAPENHAWNMVKLDNEWYFTDVTWDDQENLIFYEFLNNTYDQISIDHTLEETFKNYIPKSSSTAANYFAKEKRVFSNYDTKKIAELLKKDNYSTQIYVNGDVEKFSNDFFGNLNPLAEALNLNGATFDMATLSRAMIITVKSNSIVHKHKTSSSIPQKSATCVAEGVKEHFICDCGIWFWDIDCTKPINNHSLVNIPVIDHSASDWKSDTTHHWKICTVCGSKISNTYAEHSGNNNCTMCSAAMPTASNPATPSQNAPLGAPQPSQSTVDLPQSSENTSTTENPSGNVESSELFTSSNTPIENHDSSNQTIEIESIPENVFTADNSSNDTTSYSNTITAPQSKNLSRLILICIIIAAIITTVATVLIIFVKKSK